MSSRRPIACRGTNQAVPLPGLIGQVKKYDFSSSFFGTVHIRSILCVRTSSVTPTAWLQQRHRSRTTCLALAGCGTGSPRRPTTPRRLPKAACTPCILHTPWTRGAGPHAQATRLLATRPVAQRGVGQKARAAVGLCSLRVLYRLCQHRVLYSLSRPSISVTESGGGGGGGAVRRAQGGPAAGRRCALWQRLTHHVPLSGASLSPHGISAAILSTNGQAWRPVVIRTRGTTPCQRLVPMMHKMDRRGRFVRIMGARGTPPPPDHRSMGKRRGVAAWLAALPVGSCRGKLPWGDSAERRRGEITWGDTVGR